MNRLIVIIVLAITSYACRAAMVSTSPTLSTITNNIYEDQRPRAVTCNVNASVGIPGVLLNIIGNWNGNATNAVISTEAGSSTMGTTNNPFNVSLPIYFSGQHDVLLNIYRSGTLVCQAITTVN